VVVVLLKPPPGAGRRRFGRSALAMAGCRPPWRSSLGALGFGWFGRVDRGEQGLRPGGRPQVAGVATAGELLEPSLPVRAWAAKTEEGGGFREEKKRRNDLVCVCVYNQPMQTHNTATRNWTYNGIIRGDGGRFYDLIDPLEENHLLPPSLLDG